MPSNIRSRSPGAAKGNARSAPSPSRTTKGGSKSSGGSKADQPTQAVRVVVRVRPQMPTDQGTSCEAMQLDPDGVHIQLTPPSGPQEKRQGHKYQFDAALYCDATQEDVYEKAHVQQLVNSAASGIHATIFAYGQTGSGKTYTMEGYSYHNQPKAKGAPVADFDMTPPEQLGITPRAVFALFEALNKDPERRFCVKCSYVQIYKEQAYDLLNPTSLMAGPGGEPPSPNIVRGKTLQKEWNERDTGGLNQGALRMRWSKQEDFYLENLFKVEVGTADEALSLFRAGVSNKVMASHRLNAQSSRSHCLFTLYIDTCPMASPTEVISSRLTLVDLAGSERGATVGATEGRLRDESVAINKSLFTLRHVITCLADNSTKEAKASSGKEADKNMLPPYRDSKLTSLLKNSLGGNAMTVMVACVAPVDSFYEENLSTLEYARQAARITNVVQVNEDPKTKLIRELRAEVAFLREQLAAVQGPGAAALGYRPSQGFPTGGGVLGAGLSEEMRQKLLESTENDINMMVSKLIDAIGLVQSLSAVNQQLRSAYDEISRHSEELRIDNDSLMIENAQVRDQLSFIESMTGIDASDADARRRASMVNQETDDRSKVNGALYNPQTAALLELQELRRENQLLHDRLKAVSAPGGLDGRNGTPLRSPGPGAVRKANTPNGQLAVEQCDSVAGCSVCDPAM